MNPTRPPGHCPRGRALLAASLLLIGCTDRPSEDSAGSDSSDSGSSTSVVTNVTLGSTTIETTGVTLTSGTDSSDGSSTSTGDTTNGVDSSSGTGVMGCMPGDPSCSQLDLLFVVDNSGTMGEEQLTLARSFPLFVEQLRSLTDSMGMPLGLDVQVMVTTTDMGNPLCTPFEPPGYDPARGAPTSTPCTDRLQDFTDLIGTTMIPEACTNLCPVGVAPTDDFVAFDAAGSNVPGAPADINGDGMPESPAAQALACLGPQGINGCGFESPLESMLQALNPASAWNGGATPFLRPDAMLGIVLVSDEADCSVQDFSIMEDPAYQNTNPDTGAPAASSAICWNAGVTCMGPDAMGVYSNCTALNNGDLQPLSRYTSYLIDDLRITQGKQVFMLGVVGVPQVTAHSPDPPYDPTAGGVFDLVYRDWIDGQYPVGDILPDEFAMGETAADKQFDFGIGPGCTGTDGMGQFTGQAIPPVRMLEVCEALDLDATPAGTRCCVESVCDDDYSGAIGCLTGMVTVASQGG